MPARSKVVKASDLAAVAVVTTVPAVAIAVAIEATAASVSTAVTARTGHHAAVNPAAKTALAKAAGEHAEMVEGEVAERAAEEAVERAAGVVEAMEGVTGDFLSQMLHLDAVFCCLTSGWSDTYCFTLYLSVTNQKVLSQS